MKRTMMDWILSETIGDMDNPSNCVFLRNFYEMMAVL